MSIYMILSPSESDSIADVVDVDDDDVDDDVDDDLLLNGSVILGLPEAIVPLRLPSTGRETMPCKS
jgi:hypothetical protein